MKMDSRIGLTMSNDCPLVWIRKLIKAGAFTLHGQYWLGLGGCVLQDRINFLYDANFNIMDDEITRLPCNVDYQGDLMAVVVFASLFKLWVVMYQATSPMMTYYLDGRNFDKGKGIGIIRATFDGIKPKKVPDGDAIFTVVQYKTDDSELCDGNGPEHCVLAETPKKKVVTSPRWINYP